MDYVDNDGAEVIKVGQMFQVDIYCRYKKNENGFVQAKGCLKR